MSKSVAKILSEMRGDDHETTPSFFETDDFERLCLAVVGFIRMAEKTKQEATYRFLKEHLGDNTWLFEAVESCKCAGLIKETGSAVRTVFTLSQV